MRAAWHQQVVLAWMLAAVCLYVSGCLSEKERAGANSTLAGPPVLVCPQEILLGEREFGEQLQPIVEVENRGASPLELGSFRKTCACGPVEVQENGVFMAATSAVVPPGQKRQLRMPMAVAGDIGLKSRQRLEFTTNDPKQPVVAVDLVVERVLATANAVPPNVAFQSVLIDTPVTHVVEIRDPAATPREILSIETSDPQRLAIDREEPSVAEADQRTAAGRLVTRLRIKVNTSKAGTVAATIRVAMAGQGKNSLTIGVSGYVEPPVRSVPRDVILPRRTSRGKLYETSIMLRPFAGAVEHVELRSAPPGITVTLPTALASTPELVVAMDTKLFPTAAPEEQRTIRLVIRVKGEMHEVLVPVLHVP